MKLILDFDDVLFKNTPEFKDWMFSVIAEAGVMRKKAEAEYKKVRMDQFSLRNFLTGLIGNDDIYKKIISICSKLVNEEMIASARQTGRENCYLVTNGDREFQEDKIRRSGIVPLFKEIHILPGSKKEVIEKICQKNPGEEIIFYDDKEKFFADLDRRKYPNLKTVLYKRGEPLEL